MPLLIGGEMNIQRTLCPAQSRIEGDTMMSEKI